MTRSINTQRRLLTRLDDKFTKMRELHREAVALAKDVFPIGALVVYVYGEKLREVEVVGHNSFIPKLKVKGKTGKEHWIEITQEMIEENLERLEEG